MSESLPVKSTSLSDVWVVTATYNEAENLPLLLKGILELDSPVNICVVDDASPDGTGQLADEWAVKYPGRMIVRHRAGKLGYASAHREGIRDVLANGAQVVITMDADLSHEPCVIPIMLQALETADVVIGSRYVPGGKTVNWTWDRVFLSRFGGGMITRLLTGLRQADCTSGYRAYRKETLEQINPWSTITDGYGFLVELLFRSAGLGLKVTEVPITFVDRRAGHSKLSKKIVFESALLCLRLFGQRLTGNSHKNKR